MSRRHEWSALFGWLAMGAVMYPVSGILVAIGALLVALFLLTIGPGISVSMGLGGLANRVLAAQTLQRSQDAAARRVWLGR